jgi:SecD/SecF fusion protein
VQGFALVLGLGTLVSLFTAVLATQAILGTMSRTRILARPSALGAGKPKRAITFDFMGASRWFFSASGVLLLVGALAIGASGLTFGIDFESGTRINAAFERDVSTAQVREVLGDAGLSTTEAKIQEVSSEGDDAEGPAAASEFQISTGQLAPDEVTGITGALTDAFGQARPPDTQSIGPTFGASVADAALKAIILSFLVIAAYISVRFQPKYAVPVLIAIMHDVLLTAGVYSLTGREVTTATVAALLTILGYSLYDTIIVFDRIRENVPRLPRATFSQVTNRSMSEVLVRSLATTVSTLLPVLCLFLFGGETLRDFAFALMVGIVSGTYSSIFIATPVLVAWKEREPVYARRRAALEREHGGTVPAYPVTVATVGADAPVAERRARPRPTAPGDPARGVSREEFDAMVADLGIEETGRRTAIAEREEDTGADARVEDVRMPGEDVPKKRERSKRPRNRRHGRPR